MANIFTASYDANTIPVSEMVKDPTFIPEQTLEFLDGSFLENLLFRDGGSNAGAVAYREAAAPFLMHDAENVAEGAEIPVAGLQIGEARTAIAQKNALAIRVSLEMIRRNSVDMVSKQQTALQNTMISTGVKATLNAFNSAPIQTLAASAAWGAQGSDPVKDVLDAVENIQGATADRSGVEGLFNYNPTHLVLHPKKLTALLRNEQVQKFYVGDNASENPVYRGVQNVSLFGLTVATSRWMKPEDVYVLESGVAGFISTEMPLQMTPLYEEGGASGSGGPQQTWRTDAFRSRVIAVDNPKAVVKITGA